MTANPTTAKLYGIGVGPGDPELITLKAVRLIAECDVIGYIANRQGHSMARQIATSQLEQRTSQPPIELPVTVTMSCERTDINAAYDAASEQILAHLACDRSVGFLCEGDPLFFGSFAYLVERLSERCAIEIVPGVPAIMAGTALSQRPLGLQLENFAVVTGRHSDEMIVAALNQYNNVAIMKVGRNRANIKRLINTAGRTQDACYIEHMGYQQQRIVHDITALDETEGPYFSVFLVNQRRHSDLTYDHDD